MPFKPDSVETPRTLAAHRGRAGSVLVLQRRLDRALEALEKAHAAERLGRVLLRECDHRAKNTLTLAAALLARQRRLASDERLRAPLEAARQRLIALSKLHDAAYADFHSEIRMEPYLRDICPGLSTDHVVVTATAPDEHWPAQIASPSALLAAEAVTNAIKHAFPFGRRGAVRVDLAIVRCGAARLAVEDDGVGLPQVPEAHMGFELIHGLAAQLGGHAEIATSPRGGCRVATEFAVPHFQPCQCPAGNDKRAGARAKSGGAGRVGGASADMRA
jgi:two-component sensor histidine kinase